MTQTKQKSLIENVMKLKIIGTIQPATIYHVRFSANGIEQTKCTSTNTYMQDASIFASQFKKVKDVAVTMEILTELGREHKSYTE